MPATEHRGEIGHLINVGWLSDTSAGTVLQRKSDVTGSFSKEVLERTHTTAASSKQVEDYYSIMTWQRSSVIVTVESTESNSRSRSSQCTINLSIVDEGEHQLLPTP